ncbi:unnamed protein product [Ascophyllum nodosum]
MSPFYCSSARAFLLVCLAAINLPSASQQEIQCTSTDDPDFDFEAIVQEGFEIRWVMDTTADTITFEVLNSAQSWTAIGFSEDGAMVGSDAVIGMPANTSVNEYSLTAQDEDSIDLFGDQEITSTSIGQDGDGTTITFTRPLTPANSEKQTLSSTPGEESWIIWAFGADNDFDYHGPQNREAFLLDLFCGETVSLETTITPSVMPTITPTSPPTQEGGEAPEMTLAPLPTPIPATEAAMPLAPDEVTTTNPTASPTYGVIASEMTPAPVPTPIPATEAAMTLAPDEATTTNPTASPTSGVIAPGMTPAPSPTPIAATDAVTTSNPTASPTFGAMAPGRTRAPATTPTPVTEVPMTSAPSEAGSPDGNRAGGVHGSFRVGSSGGGWWVTASTGLSALLGATLALSW